MLSKKSTKWKKTKKGRIVYNEKPSVFRLSDLFRIAWKLQTVQVTVGTKKEQKNCFFLFQIVWILSRGSMQAAHFNTFGLKAGILELIAGTGVYLTDFVMGLCRNDCAAGHASSTIQADVAAACLELQQQGLAVHVQTIPPNTGSQDAWASTANQFYIYSNSVVAVAVSSGSSTISITSSAPSGFSNGQLIGSQYGTGIPPGTTATLSSKVITLSALTTAPLSSGNQLACGTTTPNNYAATAIAYNASLLANYGSTSYNNNGFVYQSVQDIGGAIGIVSSNNYMWIAGSQTYDGIHPNQTGGNTIKATGIPGTTRFGRPTA